MAKKIRTVITITEDGIRVKTNDPEFMAEFDERNEGKDDEGGGDFGYTLNPRQLRRMDRVVRQLERKERRKQQGR